MIKFKLIKFIAGLMLFLLVVTMASFSHTDGGSLGKAKIPDKISRWRPIVQEYCDKYKCSDQVDLLLAVMYQEIGETDTLDVMQSSESMGLAPNAIQDPIQSIEAGVKHFKNVLDYGNSKGVDFSTIVQSYNFGSGYIDYVSSRGGKHTKELAISFSAKEATANGWSSYGDVDYVVHVMSKVGGHAEGSSSTNSALKETDFSELMKVATEYEGQPYVFGGNSPDAGFDCSGIVQYAYSKIGIKLSRTAQNQYDQSTKITASEAKAGDLVFFTGTYNCADYITHVGIYVSENKMYQAGGPGLGYIDLTDSYYQAHLVGFGRVNG